MRKQTILLSLAILFTSSLFAQKLQPTVPEDAFMVSRISGASLESKMSLEDMDELPIFRDLFKEEFADEGVRSFKDFGVDFDTDSYIYAMKNDSLTAIIWTMGIADIAKFEKVVVSSVDAEELTSPYLDGEFAMSWDDNGVVISNVMLNSTYVDDRKDELTSRYLLDAEQSQETEMEIEIEEAIDAAIEAVEEAARDAAEAAGDAAEGEIEEYEVVEDATVVDEYGSGYEGDTDYDYGYDYGYGYMGWEEKNLLKEIWNEDLLERVLKNRGENPLPAAKHGFIKNSTADASVFMDYGGYMRLMMDEMMPSAGMGGADMAYFLDLMNKTYDSDMTAELNFEKDAIDMEVRYNARGEGAAEQMKMFDNSISPKFFNYMNSDELLGYYSMSISTENTLRLYSDLAGFFMGAELDNAETGELISDLIDLTIDEEALGEFMTGNAVVTFSDLSMRTIEYTTYDYDENWNRMEVVKEKEEVMPTFMAMVESKRPELVEKIFKLVALEDGLKTTDFGFEAKDSPVPFYIQVKDGLVFIGNDREQFESIYAGKFKSGLSSEHKGLIGANNSVLYFDAEELISDMEVSFTDGEVAEMVGFADGKFKNMLLTSTVEGDTSLTKAHIEIPKGEKNGWSYMINLINAFYEKEMK